MRRDHLFALIIALTLWVIQRAAAADGAPELVLNIDHVGEITAVAVSPDSRWIASGSQDRTIKLWDAASGRLLRTLTGHRGAVVSVTFAADGETLYSGSRDGTVKAWAAQTGRLLATYAGAAPADGATTAIAAQPLPAAEGLRSVLLARAAEPDHSIALWRAGGAPAEPIPPLTGHLQRVRVLCFSPDGKLLASGSDDGVVKLWDTDDGQLQRTLKAYAMPVTTLSFSADSKLLLTGSDDGIAKVWDAASGEQQQELQMNRPGDGVGAVAISPDNTTVLTGGHGGVKGRDYLMLWDRQSGNEIRALSGHEAYVSAVAFSPDGRYFVSGSCDDTLRVWDRAPNGAEPPSHAVGTRARVPAVACDPGSGTLASAGADGAVRLWNARTGALSRVIAAHTCLVTAVAFSADGKRLASGSSDHSLRLWDPQTGEAGMKLGGATGPVNAVAFTPDGKTVVAGTGSDSADGAVMLWDAATGALRPPFTGEPLGRVRAVAVSPDGSMIATGSDGFEGGEIRLWETASGKLLLRAYSGIVRALAFSPDGKQLATGSGTRTAEGEPTGEEIRLWNARTHELQRTLTAPEEGGGTDALAYVDPRTLVSGSRSGAIRVWDARTGQLTQTLSGHVGAVLSLTAASPKPVGGAAPALPTLVASSGLDNTIRLWRIGGGATKLLATMIAVPSSEPGAGLMDSWIALAPEGFYDSAPGVERLISWQVDGDLFPVGAYEGTFHRPDMLRRALQGEVLPETGEVQQFTRGAAVPPQIRFQSPHEGQQIGGARKITVDLTVTDPRKVTRVELFANGRPVHAKPLEVGSKPLEVGAKPLEVGAKPLEVGAKPLEVGAKPLEVGAKPLEVGAKPLEVAAKPIPAAHRMMQQFRIEAPLPAGDPEVTLTALAYDQGSLQAREELHLTRGAAASAPASAVSGTQYVLSVGVSQYQNPKYNLKYASRDADTFANLWNEQGGALYRSVSVTRLLDAEATAPRVRAALYTLLENATENDTVALFLSGHGIQVGDTDYYFATHEIDPSTPARIAETALPWTVLQTTLAAVKAKRVLLFLDACHSGNALGPQQAESERMAELLAKRAGVMVFASSRGSEYSYEIDAAQQGAFTAALVEAIRDGKADLEIGGKRDGLITAEELLVYLRTRVPQLTANRQTPSCPLLRDFGEAYPIARVR